MATSASMGAESLARKATRTLESAEFKRGEMNATRRAMRLASKPEPELHLIGELCGGTGFGAGNAIACKWAFETGDRWELLEGARGGQTQTDAGADGNDTVVWAHPIDAHFRAGALQGWPRILLQAWRLDDVGRLEVEGYGFVHVPTAPGSHEVSVPLWRPVGTPEQELSHFFVGGAPALAATSVLFSAASERFRLVTAPSGTVHLRLECMHRFLQDEDVEA